VRFAGGWTGDLSSTDGATAVARFEIQGIELVVRSNDRAILGRVHETYGWFAVGGRRVSGHGPLASVEVACLREADGGAIIVDAEGRVTTWAKGDQPLVALFDAIVAGVIAALSRTGLLAIHAGVVVLNGRAVLIAGSSGRGKTTLVLGLLRRGLDLMSDELALVAEDDRTILAYPRGLHVRPAALSLFPELGFLAESEPYELGGGSEWSVGPAALGRAFGTRVRDVIPLGTVILLDGEPVADAEPDLAPVPPAIATLELVRGTPEAAWAFDDVLARLPRIIGEVPCARIRSARLEDTIDAVLDFAGGRAGVVP
jgi:hypothetical protein